MDFPPLATWLERPENKWEKCIEVNFLNENYVKDWDVRLEMILKDIDIRAAGNCKQNSLNHHDSCYWNFTMKRDMYEIFMKFILN